MKKTDNYGLALYDKEDKFNITAEKNSLNANMKIIDEALKEKATINDMTDYIEEHKEELKGETGPQGEQGIQGKQGIQGEAGPQGKTGPQGPKGEDGANGKDGKDGYTPIKGVDYFDGKDGVNGADGKDGEQGPKGDKGEQGPKGDKGDTGEQGPAGKDGTNGKDGVSVTHSWNGTTLTVTSASGTTSANLKGDKGEKGDTGLQGPKGDTGSKGDTGATGPKGDAGVDGKTPVKGTDYWTTADKEEIKEYVKGEIPTKTSQLTNDSGYLTEIELTQEQLDDIIDTVVEAQKVEFVDSVEEMTDTSRQYVLSSTGTLWKYKTVLEKAYTNLFKPSESLINKRIQSATAFKNENGYIICNNIDVSGKANKYLRIYGASLISTGNEKIYYTADPVQDGVSISGHKLTPSSQCNIVSETNEYGLEIQKFKLGGMNKTLNDSSTWALIGETFDCLRLSVHSGQTSALPDDYLGTDENPKIIITIDEEINPNQVEKQKWVDTGVLYSGGVSEERVEVIEQDVATAKENITELDTRIATLEDNSETTQTDISLIPETWHSTIDTIKTKVKAKQDEFGLDAVQFIYMSDIHVSNSKKDLVYNTVRTANLIAEETNIPFVCMTGDLMSQSSYSTEAQLLAEYQLVQEYMSFVTNDKLLAVIGNHDGAWGSATVDGVTQYYVKNINQKRMFNLAYRKQANDLKRQFNGIGLYYYVDNKPQKTRFVMLDTHYSADDSTNADGTAVYNRFKFDSFGQEQLSWLVNEALDVPEDYNIILMGHVPINVNNTNTDFPVFGEIITKYNNRGVCEKTATCTSDYWGKNITDSPYRTVSVAGTDFKDAKGKIIAYFHGHIHTDKINLSALSVPMICITTIGGDPRDFSITKTDVEATFTYTGIPQLCKFIDYKPGTYTFTYNGSKWLLDGETIMLNGVEKTIADCGITVTSTPTTSSKIVIKLDANVCRNPDNATSTSFDIVTIDKAGKKIYTTRFGAGSDREISL